jgi:hypothetical protein
MLAKGADEPKLLKAAEAVCYARIQVLRARVGEVPLLDTRVRPRKIARIDAQIAALLSATPAKVLAEFTSMRPKTGETSKSDD